MTRLTIMGCVGVHSDGRDVAPSSPQVLHTLALLLVRANHVVPAETIIEELWGEAPPRSATTTVQTYIYMLRRWLVAEPAMQGLATVQTRLPGYMLSVSPELIDLHEFERLAAEGDRLVTDERLEEAATTLRAALRLWNGGVLLNVRHGRVLEGAAVHVEEAYRRAHMQCLETELLLGRGRKLIGELRATVLTQPYNEWYHSLLVCALANAGRRQDALDAFAYARQILADDLGIDPAHTLRTLHKEVLAGNPVPAVPTEVPRPVRAA